MLQGVNDPVFIIFFNMRPLYRSPASRFSKIIAKAVFFSDGVKFLIWWPFLLVSLQYPIWKVWGACGFANLLCMAKKFEYGSTFWVFEKAKSIGMIVIIILRGAMLLVIDGDGLKECWRYETFYAEYKYITWLITPNHIWECFAFRVILNLRKSFQKTGYIFG